MHALLLHMSHLSPCQTRVQHTEAGNQEAKARVLSSPTLTQHPHQRETDRKSTSESLPLRCIARAATALDAESVPGSISSHAVPREGRAGTRGSHKNCQEGLMAIVCPQRGRQRALVMVEEAVMPTSAFLRTSHFRSPCPCLRCYPGDTLLS